MEAEIKERLLGRDCKAAIDDEVLVMVGVRELRVDAEATEENDAEEGEV